MTIDAGVRGATVFGVMHAAEIIISGRVGTA
jgi:hypothetical protein